jgi:hypothetical protein
LRAGQLLSHSFIGKAICVPRIGRVWERARGWLYINGFFFSEGQRSAGGDHEVQKILPIWFAAILRCKNVLLS